MLFEALAIACRQALELRLFGAGEGPLRTRLKSKARRVAPGAVTFLGFMADIRA